MTKAEVVNKIMLKTEQTISDIEITINAFTAVVNEVLGENQSIYIRGFGTFLVLKAKSKKGRNISKGTSVDIPERYKVKFKPGKELEKKLNEIKT